MMYGQTGLQALTYNLTDAVSLSLEAVNKTQQMSKWLNTILTKLVYFLSTKMVAALPLV